VNAGYLASVRIALDGQGIPFRIVPDDGICIPDVPWRVELEDDADYDRARAAVETVQRSQFTLTSNSRSDRATRYALYAIAGVTALAFATMVATEMWHTWHTWHTWRPGP
jgi:hypothetical protein